MPSDIKKSVEVSVRADLKQLLSNLKQIPGMTQDQARKMVKSLQTQLRRTESAAKKAAATNTRAMKQMGHSFEQAGKKAKSLRVQTRNAAGAFGAMEDVVSEINPELASLAVTLGTVGSAARGLARSLASGNVILIAFTVVVTAAIAAYTLFTMGAKKAREEQQALKAAIDASNKTIEKNRELIEKSNQAMGQNAGKVNEMVLKYKLMSGAITQAEVDQLKLEKSVHDMGDSLADQQDKQKAALKATIFSQGQLIGKYEHALKKLIAQGEYLDGVRGKTKAVLDLEEKIAAAKRIIGQNQDELNALEKTGAEHVESQTKQYREALKGIERIEKERAKAAKQQAAIDKAIEERRRRIEELEAKITAQQTLQNSLAERNKQLAMARMEPRAKIIAQYDIESQAIAKQIEDIETQIRLAKENAKSNAEKAKAGELERESIKNIVQLEEQQQQTRLNFREQLAEFDAQQRDLQEKAALEQAKLEEKLQADKMAQFQAGIDTTIDGIGRFATSGLEFLKHVGNENKELILTLFRIQQASALANIAMSTAQAVARAPVDYGPLAPLAVPAILAGGATQAAVVMAQPPPFHMGGLIGSSFAPDEQPATLLRGEAVLDRRTTRDLGPDGLARLQRGESMEPNVIVLSPWKHLDRYNKSARRMQTGRARGAGRY